MNRNLKASLVCLALFVGVAVYGVAGAGENSAHPLVETQQQGLSELEIVVAGTLPYTTVDSVGSLAIFVDHGGESEESLKFVVYGTPITSASDMKAFIYGEEISEIGDVVKGLGEHGDICKVYGHRWHDSRPMITNSVACWNEFAQVIPCPRREERECPVCGAHQIKDFPKWEDQPKNNKENRTQ